MPKSYSSASTENVTPRKNAWRRATACSGERPYTLIAVSTTFSAMTDQITLMKSVPSFKRISLEGGTPDHGTGCIILLERLPIPIRNPLEQFFKRGAGMGRAHSPFSKA